MARWVTLMAVRSGSCQVFALAAGGGVVVTSRAWAGALAADLRPGCGAAKVVVKPLVSEVPLIGVRVLGPLEVMADGKPADLGGPRQRCVLARLIAEHGRVVSADRLIEDLYADEAPPRALAAVQSYVSHLRRALEPDRAARAPAGVLVTSPPGYAVRLGRDAVDAWSFEEAVHSAAGLDDPAAVHAGYPPRWRLARGGLPGVRRHAWADLEASRLDELRLTATERGRTRRCGWAAPRRPSRPDRLTAEHPLREEAWRLLALALYQSGRQGDALALRRARAQLAAELGVDPGRPRELEEASSPRHRACRLQLSAPAAAGRSPHPASRHVGGMPS